MGEVAFSANYKGWVVQRRLETSEKTKNSEIVALLVSCDEAISKKSFEFCHVDTALIESYSAKIAEGKKASYSGLAEVLKTLKTGEVKTELIKACGGNADIAPIAEIYFLKALIEKIGLSAVVNSHAVKSAFGLDASSVGSSKGEKSNEGVLFCANHNGWLVVKKMSVIANTRSEEVGQALASANATMNRKMFEFSEIKSDLIDAYALKFTKGKRKGYGNLADSLMLVKENDAKENLLLACGGNALLLPVSQAYFLKTILEQLGYKANLDATTVGEVWKDLKVAKPRGNFGKKKK